MLILASCIFTLLVVKIYSGSIVAITCVELIVTVIDLDRLQVRLIDLGITAISSSCLFMLEEEIWLMVLSSLYGPFNSF